MDRQDFVTDRIRRGHRHVQVAILGSSGWLLAYRPREAPRSLYPGPRRSRREYIHALIHGTCHVLSRGQCCARSCGVCMNAHHRDYSTPGSMRHISDDNAGHSIAYN